ncbi:MAG: molybdopterin-dependent oxidoreductase, partial [Chromatiales bacterium]|nr:molybdopterin-dependent oxidoreductase [Chromatiales bacterium]
VWTTSQVVHWVRAQLAISLNMSQAQIRVIAPDVGGGFGVKGHVYPEEILVAYLARRLKRPVRWVETRQEHLAGSTHSRDVVSEVEVGFDDDGKIHALSVACLIDSGAYSPVGVGVTYNTTAHLLGPYDIEHFEATTKVVCTNKAPNAPYRGAGRPEAVQIMERVIDMIAHSLGLEPVDVRLRNMIQPEQMPYDVGLPYRDGQPIVYDSGDYPKALRRALAELGGVDAFRRRQAKAREGGRFLGLGMGCYTEGTGVGPFEGARVELDLSGKLIVAVGACPQGQGHETVFAQVAAHSWRVPIDDVIVRVGDTGMVAMGYGTVGSRSTVAASMAIEGASDLVKRKVLAIASELLEASAFDLQLADGRVRVVGAPDVSVSLAEVARAGQPGWQHRRPPDVDAGLEASFYYEPPTVTWSYAANAAIVEVDLETGYITVERYVEVHDAGVLVNPALADGQIMGGIVQGIGGALLEAIVYDDDGQLVTGSFLDYALPRACGIPPLTVIHHQSPSPLNKLGVKGLGEGGAIAPPAVLAGALADALNGAQTNTSRDDANRLVSSLPLRPEVIRKTLR